jgi:hypothetical protein
VQKYSGVSQAELFAETLLDPRRLVDFDDLAVRWSAAVRSVSFINHVPGRVQSMDWLARIQSLPTAASVSTSLAVGTWLDSTTDLMNSPGFVYLIADDPALVERDYRILRAWEKSGPYTR